MYSVLAMSHQSVVRFGKIYVILFEYFTLQNQITHNMKRFLLFAVAVLAFVGCNNAFEDEHYARLEQNVLPTLTAGFEDATRTYVEQDTYLRWHADDRLTIFYGNTLNHQYKFLGKSGATGGEFEPVKSGNLGTGNSFDHIYAVYPYDANVSLDDIEKSMSLSLPAEQRYSEDSFGRGANTMVAVTENLEDTFLAFKNACGYLKVKLYSNVATVVKSITISGNNGEKIAGAATVTMAYGETPQLSMATGSVGSITLDCGSGVMLSTDAENPTEFWFVVPPTEFSKGVTISVTNAYNAVFEKSTSNKVVVSRNEIQPMAAVEVESEEVAKPANNEIWYTATEKVDPNKDNVFGTVYLSNTYDSTSKRGVLTFKGDVTTIGERAFYYCTSLTSVTIGDSVTTIGNEAFAECSSLTSVTIPDSVTTIGDYAFYCCESLTSVTIGDSVTTIGEGAFSYCRSLTSVTIPDSVTTIGDAAFYGCDSLTSVTIPDSVTTIGDNAFDGCAGLKEVYCKATTPPTMGASVFADTDLESIYVPTASVDAYRDNDGWIRYSDIIFGYDF